MVVRGGGGCALFPTIRIVWVFYRVLLGFTGFLLGFDGPEIDPLVPDDRLVFIFFLGGGGFSHD